MLPEYSDKENLESRAEFLWQHGEFIMFRRYYNYAVILFLIDQEFAEVWHSSEKEIEKVEILTNCRAFDKYLPQIDISEITSLL